MLLSLGPYETLIICAIFIIMTLGVPTALRVYVWRKRAKESGPKR